MKLKNALLILSFFAFFYVNSQEIKENSFSTKWDNGFKIENTDKSIKMKFGGRIMYDFGFFSLNNEAETNGYTLASENGNEFRRARLFTSGTIYKNVDFKLQIDFAGGKVTLKDAFITLKKLPIGNLKVGHFKEPFRLEALTSSKYITFMERALPTSLIPERNSGFMLFNETANKRMSWQVGLFRGADKATSDSPEANGDYALTSRLAGVAVKNKTTLLHLGISHSYRKPQEDKTFGYAVRPEVHISDKYIKTSVSEVENINLFNFETALVLNSFSVQGEYSTASIKSSIKNETFSSYYIQTSYFLTGEKRTYKNSVVGFGRVKPIKTFGNGNGMGALELALRYSAIDGMDNDKMNNISAGLNWHLNPATRVMANYVVSNIKNNTQFNGDGQFSAFQMRFQIDF
jgi:phosphate-selective porin OprO and OprP